MARFFSGSMKLPSLCSFCPLPCLWLPCCDRRRDLAVFRPLGLLDPLTDPSPGSLKLSRFYGRHSLAGAGTWLVFPWTWPLAHSLVLFFPGCLLVAHSTVLNADLSSVFLIYLAELSDLDLASRLSFQPPSHGSSPGCLLAAGPFLGPLTGPILIL